MCEQYKTLTAKEKRVLKLTNKINEVRQIPVRDRLEVGFACRVLVQCNFPHSDPGKDLSKWIRTNGTSGLCIKPGSYIKNGKLEVIGYPYGNIPRLIMFYLCTEAVQRKQQVISLGDSLSKFMRSIDLQVTGGQQGTIRRFKEQMCRLLSSSISFAEDAEELLVLENAHIAHKVQLWCASRLPQEQNLLESYLELSPEFINEIWAYPIPIDLGIISAIKQSCLALDLYAWLTYRVTYIKKDTFISWLSIAGQVGSDYQDIKNFRKKALEALKKISAAWPNLNLKEVRGGILLKPSTPSVPYKYR